LRDFEEPAPATKRLQRDLQYGFLKSISTLEEMAEEAVSERVSARPMPYYGERTAKNR
jgi:hypothetical protein